MKKLFVLFCLCLPAFVYAQDTNESSSEETFQPNVRGDLMFRIGFNVLNNAPSLFEMNTWGSKSVALHYMYELPFGNSGISFRPGFGLGLEKYEFDKQVTLDYVDPAEIGLTGTQDVVIIDTLNNVWGPGTYKKSKLAANYIDIPLEFQYASNASDPKQGFKAAIGGSFGILYGAHTKVKFEANDETQKPKYKGSFNLSPFRYSAHARVGLGSFNLYFEYQLSELFKDNEGPLFKTEANGDYQAFPEVTNWRIGLGISLF